MTTEAHYPPLPPESARLGMPLLLEKLHRLTTDADYHRAALYSLRMQLEAIAESWGIPPRNGHPGTSLEVGLSASEAGSVSQLITLMQREHPGMGVDDCIADIFTAGMATIGTRLAHLKPAETGEAHF